MSSKKALPLPAPTKAAADATDAALYAKVRQVLLSTRQHAFRAVDTAMVQAYWQVGRYIVESEQGGEARATY